MSVSLLGWVGVVLTQVFYVPNTIRILRTRDVAGYSIVGWLLLFLGIVCFFAYFVVQRDPVGIVANLFGATGAGLTTLCVWLWRPGRRRALPPQIQTAELTE